MMLTLLSFQDLKQQKFTIDAEPSETVRQQQFALRDFLLITCPLIDRSSEGEDYGRERMGGISAEAHLFRFASISSDSVCSCGYPMTSADTCALSRQNPRRCQYR